MKLKPYDTLSSVSMATRTLNRLCHGAPIGDDYMQVTPPVVHSVIPLCKVGNDDTGNKLIHLLENTGGASRNVITKYLKQGRKRDPHARTALAVLPIYRDGRRGCFFDAASNATFSSSELLQMLQDITAGAPTPKLDISGLSSEELESYRQRVDEAAPVHGAFLFGYPHLLPYMQGEALANVFVKARTVMEDGGIIVMDLNGVPEGAHAPGQGLRSPESLRSDSVIGSGLQHVDILHMNEDELICLTGCRIVGTVESQHEDEFAMMNAAALFLRCGVAVVAVTRGGRGCYICCNDEDRFARSKALPSSWVDCTTKLNAMELSPDTIINTNGAGDAFTSGLLVAAMLRHTGMTVPVRATDGSTRKKTQSPTISDDAVADSSFDLKTEFNLSPVQTTPSGNIKRRPTPYTLYMREHYVTLKTRCNDDKKAMFLKCHEMWEKESDDVKSMYARKLQEDMEDEHLNESTMRNAHESDVMMDYSIDGGNNTSFNSGNGGVVGLPNSSSMAVLSGASSSNGAPVNSTLSYDDDGCVLIDDENRNLYLANRALNLESAAQLASLVATHHIDIGTRDKNHLDVGALLERAMIFPHGLEEI
mmetsp:Transcript_35225/g.81488  ORF Transcript_35225/g.81488 Transcript_35225/m.81488 type:complete len:592 (-) Transcript_35225:168-1943(-)